MVRLAAWTTGELGWPAFPTNGAPAGCGVLTASSAVVDPVPAWHVRAKPRRAQNAAKRSGGQASGPPVAALSALESPS